MYKQSGSSPSINPYSQNQNSEEKEDNITEKSAGNSTLETRTHATTRAQANTWVAPGELDRVLFVYTVADKRLKYYLGDQGSGTFAMKANLLIPQSMIDAQAPDGKLSMAKGFDGPGGATFDGTPWDGGVDNLIVSDMAFTGPHLVEYFQSGSEFTQMALYADLKGYAKLGEDPYPNIVDLKGNMTGGQLHNGSAQDFKDIPTE